jgi:hypothetical protein
MKLTKAPVQQEEGGGLKMAVGGEPGMESGEQP